MAAYDALRRIFDLVAGKAVLKYGKSAYDLDYDKFGEELPALANYQISKFHDIRHLISKEDQANSAAAAM